MTIYFIFLIPIVNIYFGVKFLFESWIDEDNIYWEKQAKISNLTKLALVAGGIILTFFWIFWRVLVTIRWSEWFKIVIKEIHSQSWQIENIFWSGYSISTYEHSISLDNSIWTWEFWWKISSENWEWTFKAVTTKTNGIRTVSSLKITDPNWKEITIK